MHDSARNRGLSDCLYLWLDINKLYVEPSAESSVNDAVICIDVGDIYSRLCSSYTSRLLNKFTKILGKKDLGAFRKYGIDEKSVECDLLKGIFNRIAFDYLLADEVAREIKSHNLDYRKVVVGDIEGVCGLNKGLLLLYLKSGHLDGFSNKLRLAINVLRFRSSAYLSLITAIAVSLLAVLLSLVRTEKTGLQAGEADELYLVHSDLGNRASHLMSRISAGGDEKIYLCLLGPGLRRLRWNSETTDNIILVRPWDRSKTVSVIFKVIRVWPQYIRNIEKVIAELKYQPSVLQFMIHSATCLVRGQLHKHWVSKQFSSVPPRHVTIGWSGWSDVTEFDLALQRAGINTVHHLHGIIGDPIGYWGVSSKCICKTKADVELLKSLAVGYYSEIAAMDCKSISKMDNLPAGISEISSILILTNLAHPANYRYKGIAENRELQLLEVVAESNKMGWQMLWRPHPCERDNRQIFERLAARAGALGIKMDSSADIHDQLDKAGIVISVFSSVLSDVVMSGKVPLLYSGVPYESLPGWQSISADLKFSSSSELGGLLEPERYQELSGKHFHTLYNLFCCAS